MFLLASGAWAQPSDATILAQLKSKNNPNLISMKIPGKGRISIERENGIEKTMYRRSYAAKLKTEWTGVTRTYRSLIVYQKVGGKWKFIRKNVGESTYDGLENPSLAVIQGFAESNPGFFVGSYRANKVVGKITDVRFADDVDWFYNDPNKVEFGVQMKFTIKGSGEPHTMDVDAKYRMTLRREKMSDPWSIGFNAGSHKSQVVVKTTPMTKDEFNMLITINIANIEANNKARIAGLPEVIIPEYKNHSAMLRHVIDLINKGDAKILEAYLRKTWSRGHFDNVLPTLLTDRSEGTLELLIKAMPVYKDQYCVRPLLRTATTSETAWYNKSNSKAASFLSKDLGNGKREIISFSIGTISPEKETAKAMIDKVCIKYDNPLRRTRKIKLNSVKGQYVFCQYGNSEWSYIGQIEGGGTKGYIIKWMDNSTSDEPAASCSNYELLEGDELYYKNRRGEIVKAWMSKRQETFTVVIKDLAGNEQLIHLKDLRFK